MSEELVVREVEAPRLTANEIVARTKLVRQVMDAVMKKDTHYGVIPGTQKPTLYQPGAEKLLMAFRFAPDFQVEDLSVHDERRYRVTCRLIDSTGQFVGAGLGECSSEEEKFKWKRAVSDLEWEETPDDLRRVKYLAKGKIKQVRIPPADIANTVLKMALKRALISGTRSTTAASDVFAQDLEDYSGDLGAPSKPPIRKPRAKSAPKEAPEPPEDALGGPWDDGAPPIEGEVAPDEDNALEEPTMSDATIPQEVWDGMRAGWHTKGNISDKQLKRLFAIAKGKGIEPTDLKLLLDDNLDVDAEQIPWGTPYNTLCDYLDKLP